MLGQSMREHLMADQTTNEPANLDDSPARIPKSAENEPARDFELIKNGGSVPVDQLAEHLDAQARYRLQVADRADGKTDGWANDRNVADAFTAGADKARGVTPENRNTIRAIRDGANPEDGGYTADFDTRSAANDTARRFDTNGDGTINRCDMPAPAKDSKDKGDSALFAKLCTNSGVTFRSFKPQEYTPDAPPTGNQVSGEGVRKPAPAVGATVPPR